MNAMKLMFTIVNRGDGLAMAKLYEQNQLQLHLQITAYGTATSEVLNLLGLTQTEKDLLIGFGSENAVERLLSLLDDDYRGILSVRGIAFSVSLEGISYFLASALAGGPTASKGGSNMANERASEKDHSLILVIVNQGCTDQVMQTACKAGASGGTVVRGRWVGAQRLEQFHGVTLQDEKEALLIACSKEKRNAIMDAVTKAHGIHTPEQALMCSVPIDRIIRMS